MKKQNVNVQRQYNVKARFMTYFFVLSLRSKVQNFIGSRITLSFIVIKRKSMPRHLLLMKWIRIALFLALLVSFTPD